jgi:hypothetical protein
MGMHVFVAATTDALPILFDPKNRYLAKKGIAGCGSRVRRYAVSRVIPAESKGIQDIGTSTITGCETLFRYSVTGRACMTMLARSPVHEDSSDGVESDPRRRSLDRALRGCACCQRRRSHEEKHRPGLCFVQLRRSDNVRRFQLGVGHGHVERERRKQWKQWKQRRLRQREREQRRFDQRKQQQRGFQLEWQREQRLLQQRQRLEQRRKQWFQ